MTVVAAMRQTRRVLLAHWWNRKWGRWARKDVWFEQLDDDRYLVRWRGGDWTDRDGRNITADWSTAMATLRKVLGEDLSVWKLMPTGHPDAQGESGRPGTPGR